MTQSAIIEQGYVKTSIDRWDSGRNIIFRFFFIFILLFIIPVKYEWYAHLFKSKSFYEVLSSVAGFRPGLIEISGESGKWGLLSFTSWGLTALIAIAGAYLWAWLTRKSAPFPISKGYYWLRVLARYRIAIGIIAFGYLKLYPMQMPFPSEANLHTAFGDYAPFKLYWQAVGLSLWYQIFLGFLEIGAGVLMFFRRTTALGAIINAGVLYNIAHANLAYDGAVHLYSGYFVVLSLFVLLQYIPGIWQVFIKRQDFQPHYYTPQWDTAGRRLFYTGSKYLFILLFLFYYGYKRYEMHYNEGKLKEPIVPGLADAAGYYHISSFDLNGKILPYDPLDSVRWHDAVFERYSTLVYTVNKAYPINLDNGTPKATDLFKDYEFTGRAGGKRYLYYEIDSTANYLYLVDKNQKFAKELVRERSDIRMDLKAKYQTAWRDSLHILRWQYDRLPDGGIRLAGKINDKDSLRVVLTRQKEQHPIGKGWYTHNNVYSYGQHDN
ncbi:hypothetical protein [Sphingobacterium spiritivorum]|uniref:hypothetical protein n=1 Tax=Sphingobacterium spiritivorum TaxID=258 RepID=UPI00191AA5A4|nr:hypothetical protein [Sphingobacterium spiritivorum]QQT26402.1 hypothetical protein I6J02_00665 [Sphingobacterium spiritivorum]